MAGRRSGGGWVLVLAAGLAAAMPGPVVTQTPDAPRLVGRAWRAVELGGQPSPAMDPKREAHLQFDANGRVSGSDGCNRVTGGYTVNGDTLTFGPLAGTMMACPGDAAVERAFHAAVKATVRWRVAGDRLELLDTSGTVVARFATPVDGPSTAAPSDPPQGLAGTAWQLVRFQGGDDAVLVPAEKAHYTLQFGADGRVAVRFDCNRGRATWTSPEPSLLTLGPLALSRATCPPGSLHDHLVKQWPYIRSYVLRDGHLFLSLMADGGIYEFEPMAPPRPAPPPDAGIDEEPPSFTASALLDAEVRQGPHHAVADAVDTEGFFHRFTIASDYGELSAIGRSQLDTRLHEVRALAMLDEVSKSEVFLKSAGGAVLHVGQSVVKVVTDPVDTAKGIGGGIKRLGVNIGRMSKRAVGGIGNESESAEPEQHAAEGAANALLGVSSAMRRWARKVGADPYTTNPVLFDALKDIGRIDAAGSLATKIVLPIPAIVTTSATVGDLVWGTDPEELRKINEGRLDALGVDPEEAQRFFRNRGYTLTAQTRFIAALGAVAPEGAADYVVAAAGAAGERAALFFVESAEMLQRAHAEAPVTALLTDSVVLVAAQGTTAVLVLPLDYVASTAQSREVLTDVEARVEPELGVERVEVRVTGRLSPRFRDEVVAAGWTVREGQAIR